ncbi:hypothetical protein BDB01DRAFT_720593 [Pilobolus umbonatus]|nr:hypothetical protein BDB01DRAFT_720593 [Pilobolus umbonatus]
MTDLQVIQLSGNTIGVEASRALAEVLKTKKSLKQALLSDIFTGRLLSEIPLALKALCDAFEQVDLIELDLSDNAFGPAGAQPLIDFLSNTKTLQILRLNNNGLGIGGGKMIAQALQASADKAKSEKRSSPLHTIICGRNRLEDGSSEFLARAFASHGTLQTVRMPQNGIRPDGIRTIVDGLKSCKNLRHLDLQDNTFTAKGSNALASALKSWPHLETLNISDCLLSKKGAVSIAKSLHQGDNKKIRELLMQYNEIQADAVEILAQAIQSHLNLLEKIELNGNKFDEEAAEVELLRGALAKWDHDDALDELDDMEDVSDEESEDELEEAVEEARQQEPTTKLNKAEEDDLINKMKNTHI